MPDAGTVTIMVDSTPPVSTISLTPPSPNGANGWYTTGVRIAVSATDGDRGSGVSEIRCVLDPATAPAGFDDLPAGCAYTGTGADVTTDGQHILYVSSRDWAGNEETPIRQRFQIDTTAPRVACSVSPNSIWPPNHKLIAIQVSVLVTDATSGPDGFTLTAVRSNEADSGLDKDDTGGDIQGWSVGTDDTSGQLRAERSGSGKGRIYTLTYQGKDKAGNTASCSTTVAVPHNR